MASINDYDADIDCVDARINDAILPSVNESTNGAEAINSDPSHIFNEYHNVLGHFIRLEISENG